MGHFLAEIAADALPAETEQPAFAERAQADKETIQYLGCTAAVRQDGDQKKGSLPRG